MEADRPISRRSALAAAGATALGGLAFTSLPQPASAAVTKNDLTIPDKEVSESDGEVYAPWLRISGSWSYSTDTDATEWRAYLVLTDGEGTRATLAETQGTTSGTAGEGAYTLLGRVTEAPFYDASDFAEPTEGETTSVTLHAMVIFQVRDADGILAKATLEADPTLMIHHKAPPVLVDGEGAIVVQNDESDPTPTP